MDRKTLKRIALKNNIKKMKKNGANGEYTPYLPIKSSKSNEPKIIVNISKKESKRSK
jgi:hypothetical protein